MKVKAIIKAICVLLLGYMMAGCNNFPDPDKYDRNAEITDIHVELPKMALELNEGGSETIMFWPLPANADIMKLKWVSSNTEVITIDRWGRATAGKAGVATLTVSCGSISKTVSVTVKAVAP